MKEGHVDLKERQLAWIPPGTIVGTSAPKGWSHLVYAAYPRIGAGDVDKVSASVVYYAKLFTVNCLANVTKDDADPNANYRLDRVAIGIGTDIAGKNTIVTSGTQKKLGADLDILARQVLSQCEADFQHGFTQIVRTPTLLVYDSQATLLIENQPRDMMGRYAILVSPETGHLQALVWLFDLKYHLVDQPMQALPANDREDRVLSVDAEKFFLGLPRDGAFAQLQIAQGTPIPFTKPLRHVAGLRRYTKESARELERQLRIVLADQNR